MNQPTFAALDARLRVIELKIDQISFTVNGIGDIMATQADIDAVTAALQAISLEVNGLGTALATDAQTLGDAITRLEQQIQSGQPLDLSGLQAVQQSLNDNATSLSNSVTTLNNLAAANPEPTPPPAPAPAPASATSEEDAKDEADGSSATE